MELDLRGRKAVVTGASEGIGLAIARQLGAEGCDLRIVARSQAKLDAAKEEIEAAHGVAVEVIALDLANSSGQSKLAQAWAGDTDILVNNAGSTPKGRIDEIDEKTWRAAWDLKVFGYINLCRSFYAGMKARGAGVILNIIGNGGEKPVSDYIAGSTGNAALMAFTRALGGDSPRDGIRVVGINPGPVATERLERMMRKTAGDRFGDESRFAEFTKPFAFGRAAAPEEVATMAAFLASDLSAYTSGTIVTIDGGMVNKGPLF
ncbi:MAG: short-chain dehydrogenase/reductase [Alphaproteobacteria bacterium]